MLPNLLTYFYVAAAAILLLACTFGPAQRPELRKWFGALEPLYPGSGSDLFGQYDL
jgi:hypothetical protein